MTQHTEQLENRVAARTEELKEARDEALHASQSKSRFLANMSHELRTPLNAVIGYSEMLSEDALESGENEAKQDADKIRSAGKHLLELVNDVLDISKIEADKMVIMPEKFELKPLLEEIKDTLKPMLQRRNNEFILNFDDSLRKIYGDPMRIQQILFNLLSNATKFTESGKITLSVEAYQHENNTTWIKYNVNDNGIGISPTQQKKLFHAFMQADDSTTREYGGTGLGLVICLRFCQLMGGNIEVRSELGKGSCFIVHLPKDYIPVPEIKNRRTGDRVEQI